LLNGNLLVSSPTYSQFREGLTQCVQRRRGRFSTYRETAEVGFSSIFEKIELLTKVSNPDPSLRSNGLSGRQVGARLESLPISSGFKHDDELIRRKEHDEKIGFKKGMLDQTVGSALMIESGDRWTSDRRSTRSCVT
jgi:hypothetical protein